MRCVCAGRARRPWIPTPSGTTPRQPCEELLQRPRPSAAALRHRRAQPAGPASPPLRALAGPSVLLHRAPACRAFLRFAGWRSHTIQPTTGSASFSTRGKRHADTPTRTRPDLDHKHHKSSYRPNVRWDSCGHDMRKPVVHNPRDRPSPARRTVPCNESGGRRYAIVRPSPSSHSTPFVYRDIMMSSFT